MQHFFVDDFKVIHAVAGDVSSTPKYAFPWYQTPSMFLNWQEEDLSKNPLHQREKLITIAQL